MNKEKTIATYKIVADAGGNIYKFYCDLSGALVCTTKPYKADTPPKKSYSLRGKTKANSILIPVITVASRFQMRCLMLKFWNVSSVRP